MAEHLLDHRLQLILSVLSTRGECSMYVRSTPMPWEATRRTVKLEPAVFSLPETRITTPWKT